MIIWQRFWIWIFAALLCATELPAQHEDAAIADCASCHKGVVKSYAGSPHDVQASAHNGTSVTCESCHGSGAAHATNGTAPLIFNPQHAAAKDADAKCLQCHEGARPHYERSIHAKGNLRCVDCHLIHVLGASPHLLRSKQPELCTECHRDTKAQFDAPFKHKVQEGLINCTDCHDPHGAAGKDDLPSATWQFVTCTKCHGATAGPFLFEHASVKSEGCTACHFPHGSPNPDMLTASSVNALCLRCHFPPADSTAGKAVVPEHIQSSKSPSCVSCHVSIHGSNTNAVFLRTKDRNSER